MLGKFLISGVITLVVIGTTTHIIYPPKPRVFYNPSPSAAIGWYKLRRDLPINIDSKVAAFAPEWARKLADERQYLPYDYPLIKSVLAVEGDVICYHETSVSVPKSPDIPLRSQDSLGRDMPVQSGCHILQLDEYFIASHDVQDGFDSRYFGPVRKDQLLGVVEYLGNSENKKISKSSDLGGIKG